MKTNFKLAGQTAFFLATCLTTLSWISAFADSPQTKKVLVASGSDQDLNALARRVNSPDAVAAQNAIKALRAAGPSGMNALVAASRSTLLLSSKSATQPESAQWKRLASAFEKVGAQHDNWASKLYWFTDLEAAKAEAKKENKPILSLRLLGKLDEELSCANSRFFRTALYPNANISKMLNENYILHWQSVRPVPKVTIDFGDGRKIQTTITGNSIHYVLDSNGRVLDALPGLYGPGAFFKWLERMQKINEESVNLQGAAHDTFLKKFHQERFAQINSDWQKDAGKFPRPFFLRLEPAPVNTQQSVRDTTQFNVNAIQQTANAQQMPTAREAGIKAESKRSVEIGTLQAVTIPIPRDRDALSTQNDDRLWQQIASLHTAEAKLDSKSLEVLRTKTSRPQLVAATFEKSIAEDTVRNEYSRHTTIHQWLMENPAIDLQKLNARVYTELFLTPDSDPWLGLLPADAYTGIENDGVSR